MSVGCIMLPIGHFFFLFFCFLNAVHPVPSDFWFRRDYIYRLYILYIIDFDYWSLKRLLGLNYQALEIIGP